MIERNKSPSWQTGIAGRGRQDSRSGKMSSLLFMGNSKQREGTGCKARVYLSKPTASDILSGMRSCLSNYLPNYRHQLRTRSSSPSACRGTFLSQTPQYLIIHQNSSFKKSETGWRDGRAVKTTYCTFRGSGLSSHHPHGGTPAPGDLMPFLASWEPTRTWYADTHADKTLIYA